MRATVDYSCKSASAHVIKRFEEETEKQQHRRTAKP
jgi:hypothetical protein